MFELVFNLFLIGLYIAMGGLIVVAIAVIWDLVERITKKKKVKLPFGDGSKFVEFQSYIIK